MSLWDSHCSGHLADNYTQSQRGSGAVQGSTGRGGHRQTIFRVPVPAHTLPRVPGSAPIWTLQSRGKAASPESCPFLPSVVLGLASPRASWPLCLFLTSPAPAHVSPERRAQELKDSACCPSLGAQPLMPTLPEQLCRSPASQPLIPHPPPSAPLLGPTECPPA